MVEKHSKFHGIAVSPGIAWGKACIMGSPPKITRRKIKVAQVTQELARLTQAIDSSREQIESLRDRIKSRLSAKEAAIFDAHLLFLKDPVFIAQIQKKLLEAQINIEAAVEDVIEESVAVFKSTQDGYLKERIQDIRDVGNRILDNLIGYSQKCLIGEEKHLIIVSPEITPSQAVGFNTTQIKGLITEKGGPTSHAAILARSLGIPLISGIPNLSRHIELSTPVFMNGYTGEVIINPSHRQIQKYRISAKEQAEKKRQEKKVIGLPSVTSDGQEIHLLANIRTEEDVELAQVFQAEGIGLYRTEIHFLDRNEYPDEDEQFQHYRTIVEKMAPFPVTIRTMDLGGDKFTSYYNNNHPLPERNPYLGLRAIRLSLKYPEIFKQQLRAILRASEFGNAKILLPMIASIEEIKQVKRLLLQSMNELSEQNIPFKQDFQLGAMIEIPSAALAAEAILKEVDFLSVGTNDLIQYTLAVDRGNAQVSQFYEALHPSVLFLLKHIADAARRAGKEVSICGEMAGDIRYSKLLLGLGYTHLSMSSFFIPQVKKIIRSISMPEAKALANRALSLNEVKKIKQLLEKDKVQNN